MLFRSPLSTEVKNSIKRQRKLDEGIKTSSTAQENLNLAKMEMGKLKASLGLSEVVVKSTLSTYKKTIDRKLTRGYSKNGLLAACLYASCKKMDVPRRLEEISNMMNITKKEISRCYKLIMKEIDPWMTPTNPMRFLSRIARNLGSSEKSQRKAASMIEKVLKSGKNVGKDPIGIIAGALYLAGITTGDLKSQKEISEALGVSEGTIRKRCKEIMESINSQTRNTCLG